MPNVGITESNRLAQLLQTNVNVPRTEPVRKHAFNKCEFHFSCSFESWSAITSSPRPLFPGLQPYSSFSSPCCFELWRLEIVLSNSGHEDRKGETLEVKTTHLHRAALVPTAMRPDLLPSFFSNLALHLY